MKYANLVQKKIIRNFKFMKPMKVLMCLALFQVLTAWSNTYEDYGSNLNLELCNEFWSYIERHKDKKLYCELTPDDEFKGFKLPKFSAAPKGLFERIYIQSRAVQSKSSRLKAPHTMDGYKKIVAELEEYAKPGWEFLIGVIDINHDGKNENVLYIKNRQHCLNKGYDTSSISPFDENLNIGSEWIGDMGYAIQSGLPFFSKDAFI